jgi:hypothetical protein
MIGVASRLQDNLQSCILLHIVYSVALDRSSRESRYDKGQACSDIPCCPVEYHRILMVKLVSKHDFNDLMKAKRFRGPALHGSASLGFQRGAHMPRCPKSCKIDVGPFIQACHLREVHALIYTVPSIVDIIQSCRYLKLLMLLRARRVSASFIKHIARR